MEKEEAKKVLKSSWVMTTGHTLDKNNAELKEAIETILNQEEEECLHCGKGKASYCENCYQELIGINAKLQNRLNELNTNKPLGSSCTIKIKKEDLEKAFKPKLEEIVKNIKEEYIDKQLIKEKLAEAEEKLKIHMEVEVNARHNGKPIATYIETQKLINEIEIYKELLNIK